MCWFPVFSKFLGDHCDPNTNKFTVITYTPSGPGVPRGSQELTFNVGFLGVFEVLLF